MVLATAAGFFLIIQLEPAGAVCLLCWNAVGVTHTAAAALMPQETMLRLNTPFSPTGSPNRKK